MADYTLDARHLLCPLPVLRAGKILRKMSQGQILRIRLTDPSSRNEFQIFQSERKDFIIMDMDTSDTFYTLTLQKITDS